jgi:CRISPR type III-B/RAMP module RAMP protein Cmr1
METIKSVTNCPTCGAECKIGGTNDSTHYYIPVENKETPTALEILNKYIDFSKDGIIEREGAIKAMQEYATILLRKQAEAITEIIAKQYNDGRKIKQSILTASENFIKNLK